VVLSAVITLIKYTGVTW